jgi:hypothetical protein
VKVRLVLQRVLVVERYSVLCLLLLWVVWLVQFLHQLQPLLPSTLLVLSLPVLLLLMMVMVVVVVDLLMLPIPLENLPLEKLPPLLLLLFWLSCAASSHPKLGSCRVCTSPLITEHPLAVGMYQYSDLQVKLQRLYSKCLQKVIFNMARTCGPSRNLECSHRPSKVP